MYLMSSKAIEAFKQLPTQARITVDLLSGKIIPDITEKDIESLSLERSSVSGKSVEIGSARAFELTLELNNHDGKFGGINFDGAKISVRVGAGGFWCPLGLFTIDGHKNKTGSVELTALDRMVWFDKQADFSGTVFPVSVKDLVIKACYSCGVDSSKLKFNSINATYPIKTAPKSAVTWRTVLMWCAEIMGVCAYIDSEGYLVMKWYETTGEEITASDRYDHTLHESDVVLAGVKIIDGDKAAHAVGSQSGFVFSIEGNELISDNCDLLAQNLGHQLIGFKHRPFTAETLSMPHLFPMDLMTYVEPDGTTHPVCITGYEFTLNGNTKLKGTGESETTSGYASLNPLTAKEQAIINASLKHTEEKVITVINEKQTALLRMNEIIANATGLYLITDIDADNGSTHYYFTNKPALADSTLIYVWNAGGFAWATEWGGSNSRTSWIYGITKDGNAVLNYLSLNKLTADQIDVESLNIVKVLNASAETIILKSNRLEIESDYFTLTAAGEITATSGKIGGFTIGDTALSALDADDLGVYVGTDEIYTSCMMGNKVKVGGVTYDFRHKARAGLRNGRLSLRNSYLIQVVKYDENMTVKTYYNYYYPLIEISQGEGSEEVFATIYIFSGKDTPHGEEFTEFRTYSGTIEELTSKIDNSVVPVGTKI